MVDKTILREIIFATGCTFFSSDLCSETAEISIFASLPFVHCILFIHYILPFWIIRWKIFTFLYILSLLSAVNKDGATTTFLLSFVGGYSLFPLLFNPELTTIKVFFLISFVVLFYIISEKSNIKIDLKSYEIIYLFGFAFVFWYEQHLQFIFGLDQRLPFLPLLIVSVYCSAGVTYFWLRYYYSFLVECETRVLNKKKGK